MKNLDSEVSENKEAEDIKNEVKSENTFLWWGFQVWCDGDRRRLITTLTEC